MKRFSGLVAAAYTPMREDFSIDLDKIGQLVEYAVAKKYAGLFTVGSTGEFSSLTVDERKQVAKEYIRCAAGRIPVIVNVGSCSHEVSSELAAHAAAQGADAICTIAPFYFRPASVRALADFVKLLAPACDGRPLFLYHVPGITGVNLSMPDFLSIMLDEVPNFSGLKFTCGDLYTYKRCVDLSDRLQILSGVDEVLLAALAMGAEAAVGTTYNYLPKVYNGIIRSFRNGDMPQARKYMELSHRAVSISARYGMPSIKLFMKFAGIDVGPMRPPVARLSAEQEKAFRGELSAAGLDEYIG